MTFSIRFLGTVEPTRYSGIELANTSKTIKLKSKRIERRAEQQFSQPKKQIGLSRSKPTALHIFSFVA